jgi:3-deoxy-D-manno-octulosonic-acid transferase
MSLLYSILYFLVFFISSPYWLARIIMDGKYLKVFRTRVLGPGKLLPKSQGVPRVWVWALSLGEVLSARELVKALKAMGLEVVISSTTMTGLAMAKSLWPSDKVTPSPFDFALSAKRYLRNIDPDFFILVETDLWPRILKELKTKGIRSSLVSARLSPRSYKRLRLIKGFWRKVLGCFDSIAVQTEDDLVKFKALGADIRRIKVTGNLKFDENLDPAPLFTREKILSETGWPEGRYIVAGSVHPGEDSLLISVFKNLTNDFQDLKMVLAPRDKPKFEVVWKRISEAFPGECARRSEPQISDKDAKIFLLDTLGELSRFYALSKLSVIGKSFPGRHEGGGHNPLEAAALGSLVISGPQNHNFKTMYQALKEAGGALIVEKDRLQKTLIYLLNNPAKIKEMGDKGRNFVLSHGGAVERTLEFIGPPKAGLPPKDAEAMLIQAEFKEPNPKGTPKGPPEGLPNDPHMDPPEGPPPAPNPDN